MSLFSYSYIRRKFNSGLNRFSRKREHAYVLGLPYEVQLVPTNACNLRCKSCPKTYYNTDNRHLAPEAYDRVKKELFPHIRILDLQGLGEPLLSPLFPQMVEDAYHHGIKIRFVSNATKFTPFLMKRLVECGADVTISLDGACAETHEDARPGAGFSLILNVMEEFRSLKNQFKSSDFHLSINTVVTKRNVYELEAILDLGIRHQITAFSLINPGVGDRKDDYALSVIAHYPELFSEQLNKLIPKAQAHSIILQYPYLKKTTEQNLNSPGTEKVKPLSDQRLFPGKCFDPWRLTYIDVDGWVRPCCRAIWIGMGNIMEKPFREIWNDAPYKELRRYVNSNNPPDFCRTCTLFWGITRGNELYMEDLEKRGIELSPPPFIGLRDNAHKG
ncbi:radical SAM protein [Candidatus Sumerlaeota bacterium]|nr:radical SAM protein [Candidatus Sumerlaeota bacterium]